MSDFVCGCIIEFTDGGEPESQILHRGTLEECERVGKLIPGIAYKGSRPVKEARFVIRGLSQSEVDEREAVA